MKRRALLSALLASPAAYAAPKKANKKMSYIYTGAGYVVAEADGGSGTMIPRFAAMDRGATPFTYPPGLPNEANGFAFIAGANPVQPLFWNLINCGTDDIHPNAQASTLRIWGRGNSVGGADNGIEVMTANGPFDTPTKVKTGDKLAKFAGFGYATNGYALNDGGVMYFTADQDFSDTSPKTWPYGPNGPMTAPDPDHTKAGTAWSIETCNLDTNYQVVRLSGDAKANVAVGDFPRAGNNFPGKGTLIIKESALVPAASIAGAGQLYVENGALKYRGPSGTVTTLAPA